MINKEYAKKLLGAATFELRYLESRRSHIATNIDDDKNGDVVFVDLSSDKVTIYIDGNPKYSSRPSATLTLSRSLFDSIAEAVNSGDWVNDEERFSRLMQVISKRIT